MIPIKFPLFCFGMLLIASALCGQEPADVEMLKKGQPKDVQTFISRAFLCQHWGNEEPYDKDRAEQIKRAVKNLRCDRLQADESRLLRKYRKRPKVLAAINAANQF